MGNADPEAVRGVYSCIADDPGVTDSNARPNSPETSSAAFLTGSLAKWAYRAVVWTWV